MTWQVQEAKNKLSEVIDAAQRRGPQTITRRGREVAVLLSAEEYQQLARPKVGLVELLRNSPLVGADLQLDRDPNDRVRKLDL